MLEFTRAIRKFKNVSAILPEIKNEIPNAVYIRNLIS